MSRDRWAAAPKEVNPDLRAAGAQIIYFEADGAFTLWSGTVYSQRHEAATISAGDSETLYSGHWTQSPSGLKISMKKVYADVRIIGETLPSQEEVLIGHLDGNRILFRSFWFERTPSMDSQMQNHALGARERHNGK